MNKEQKEMTKVLDETVEFYSKNFNKRGLDPEGICVYRDGEKRCAIGRLLSEKDLDIIEVCRHIGMGVPALLCGHLVEQLTSPILKMPEHFLTALQRLHDGNEFWSEEGITETGQNMVKGIKQAIDDNSYKVWDHVKTLAKDCLIYK